MPDAPPSDVPSSDGPSSDVIELRGLRALAVCGVLASEQARPQPVSVDVEIETDLRSAGRSDDLGDTIDYSVVAAQIETVLIGERFSLLEHMAERLAEVVLADPRALAVTLTVRKLRPPVPQQIDTTGVRITRRNGGEREPRHSGGEREEGAR